MSNSKVQIVEDDVFVVKTVRESIYINISTVLLLSMKKHFLYLGNYKNVFYIWAIIFLFFISGQISPYFTDLE